MRTLEEMAAAIHEGVRERFPGRFVREGDPC
jgi:hypothetical protein